MTIENNKLIAEFMGMEHCYRPYGDGFMEVKEDGSCIELEDLQYHTSWDWLIPVIKRCKEKQYFGSQHLIGNIDFVLSCDLTLENLHKAVLKFIKEYKTINN